MTFLEIQMKIYKMRNTNMIMRVEVNMLKLQHSLQIIDNFKDNHNIYTQIKIYLKKDQKMDINDKILIKLL
jgi:hypothetical protein